MARFVAGAPAPEGAVLAALTEPYGSSSSIGFGGERRADGVGGSGDAATAALEMASTGALGPRVARATRRAGPVVDAESTVAGSVGRAAVVATGGKVAGSAVELRVDGGSIVLEGLDFSPFEAERHPTRTTSERMSRVRTSDTFCKHNAAVRRSGRPQKASLAVDVESSSMKPRATS